MKLSRMRWLVVTAMTLSAGAAPAGAYELFIDPWGAPGVLRRVLDDPGQLRGFSRVHLLVFSNGQTLYPTRVEPFSQAPPYAGKEVLAQAAAACAQAGAPLFYAVELLRWERDDVAPSALYQQAPGLFEVGEDGSCSPERALGKYASPFHPEVRAALARLVEEVAGLATPPEGITLQCRLAVHAMLGYSEAARVAYIRAASRDPIDLSTTPELAKWALAREEHLTGLVRELVAAMRAKRPGVKLMAWGAGNNPILPVDLRGRNADNWLRWLQEGLVEAAALETPWGAERNKRLWGVVRQIAWEVGWEDSREPQRAGKERVAEPPLLARLIPLVRSRDGGKPQLEKALAGLAAQGAEAERAILWPLVDEDWEGVRAAATATAARAGAAGKR